MHTVLPPHDPEAQSVAHRRPVPLDLVAGVLLLASVVLHVVAMFPSYGPYYTHLASTTDQAGEYAVVAAAWALALVIGLLGPHRTPVAAGLAVGLAVTEFGSRLYDIGYGFRHGMDKLGGGVWWMFAAWLVGAAGATAAALAARARHRPTDRQPAPAVAWEDRDRSVLDADEDPDERLAWTVLVALLAILVSVAFLPAWDHLVATRVQTGRSITQSLGNAFHTDWQQMVGNVIFALALLVVPLVAVRMRNKAVGAAAVCGGLLVLAGQLLSAVLLVDEPVPSYLFGLTPDQAKQLGLVFSFQLTGWFTVDALAALALFGTVMIWSTLRVEPAAQNPYANSPEGARTAPFARSSAIPPSS